VGKPVKLIKNDFSAGELSPRLKGRVDLDDYIRGLKTCKNFIPFIQGPIQTRPGTKHVAEVIRSGNQSRLIPFKFGTTISYILEFADRIIRVYTNNSGTYEKVSNTIGFTTDYDASTQIDLPGGLAFKSDGTIMYVTDVTGGTVYQYTLSVPWDINTASYASKNKDISAEDSTLSGLYMKADGTKIFTSGVQNKKVYQYTLSTPWDISTASYDSKSADISGEDVSPQGVSFKTDGLKMYVAGEDSNKIYQYTLGTAWDVSTASYDSVSLDISSEDGGPLGIDFVSDGTAFYMVGVTNKVVYKYTLSSAWDLSTASYSNTSYYVGTQDSVPRQIAVGEDSEKFYICGATNDKVYFYSDEVFSPYTSAQLRDIQFAQSNDILYVAHPSHAPQKLLRAASDDWGFVELNFIPPPTQEIKEESSTTLTLSAATGTGITVTAGANTFLAADVGRTITAGIGKLEITAYSNATTVTADVIDNFDALTYAAGAWYIKGTPFEDITIDAVGPVGSARTITCNVDTFRSGGDSLPTDVGKYIYFQTGVFKITAVGGPQSITVKCLRVASVTTATYDWTMEKPIWNATDGYPSTVVFHQDRLIWGGSTGFPQTIAASVVGDYENHERGTNDADAYLITLNAREVNSIEWILSRQDLIVGTTEAEWAIQSSTGLLTPSDIAARLQTAYGSKSLRPAVIDGSILFYQRLGRKMRELTFDFNVSGYTAPELSLMSEHITEGGMDEVTYQQSPMSILWQVRNDGQLVGFTYDKRANSIAWHRHVLGGAFSSGDAVVESVAAIPHPTDDYDELWMIVKRTINSATSRRIEVLTKIIDDPDTVDAADFYQVDSGKAFAGGGVVSTITGLSDWEGETLSVIDSDTGGYLGEFTVSGGEISLGTQSLTNAITGYKFNSDIEILPIVMNIEGFAQADYNRVSRLHMLFYKSMNGQFGTTSTDLEDIPGFLASGEALTDPPDLKSEILEGSVPGAFRKGGALFIRQNKPFPMTLLSIIMEVDPKLGSAG
jgi:hypothetical protein